MEMPVDTNVLSKKRPFGVWLILVNTSVQIIGNGFTLYWLYSGKFPSPFPFSLTIEIQKQLARVSSIDYVITMIPIGLTGLQSWATWLLFSLKEEALTAFIWYLILDLAFIFLEVTIYGFPPNRINVEGIVLGLAISVFICKYAYALKRNGILT